MADRVQVRLEFTVPERDDVPSYTDALFFETIADYTSTPLEGIEAMKLERYNNWRQVIADAQDAPPPPPPTAQDALEAAETALEAAQAAIDAARSQTG